MKYIYLLYIYAVFPLAFLGLAKHKILTLSNMGYVVPALFIVMSAFFPTIFHLTSRMIVTSGKCKIRFGFLPKLAVFLLSVVCSLAVFAWSPGAYILQCQLTGKHEADLQGEGFYAVDNQLYIDAKVGFESLLSLSSAERIAVKDCVIM
ncbi:hypothetical protein MN202_04510 [Rheinheimera muenzenbergensis]|uniref:Uncharacterized protein n=1 Tax=Rheinheimera muenzenbergensis TaxID=1193628 RepID=A0ABU8C3I7_9GAMM